MSTPDQPDDPRKPAWDAVFAYICTLPREGDRPNVVERNAMIWRAVNAALAAIGYPDADQQQAAPAQPEQPLRQRLAEALDATFTSIEDFDAETAADAVYYLVQDELHLAREVACAEQMAVVRAELDARDSDIQQLRKQLAAVPALHRPVQRGAMTICDACSPLRGDGPSRYVLVIYPCPTARALNAKPRPTT